MDDPEQLDKKSDGTQTITRLRFPFRKVGVRFVVSEKSSLPILLQASAQIPLLFPPATDALTLAHSTYVLTIQALVIAFMGLV